MTTSDYLAIFALLISLLAFYWTALRGPRLIGGAIRHIRFMVPKRGNTVVCVPVVVTNQGARAAVVSSLRLRVLKEHTFVHQFYAFCDSLAFPGLQNNAQDFEQVLEQFAVKPGDTVVRNFVWFIADQPEFEFGPGEYTLELVAHVPGRSHPHQLRQVTVYFDSSLGRDVDVAQFQLHARGRFNFNEPEADQEPDN